MAVLASPYGPAVITGWCDFASDIRPFLVFCGPLQSQGIELRQHPTWGRVAVYHPCVYELLGREFVGLFDILGVTAL